MKRSRFTKFLITNVLCLLLALSLVGVTKATAPVSFSGQLDVVFVDNGGGIFSGTLFAFFMGGRNQIIFYLFDFIYAA